MPHQTTAPQTVLFVITKSNWGGAQRYVFDLATNLDRAYTPLVALGGDGELRNRLQQHDIPTHTIPTLSNSLNPLTQLRTLRDLHQLYRKERPDVVHCNSSVSGFLGVCAGRAAGVPRIIFTSHGWSFNEARPLWQRVFFKFLHWLTVLLSHQTIAVSYALKNQMIWPGATAKITVIHNGRAPIAFMPRADARSKLIAQHPELATYQNDYWTATIAELHPVKQHEKVIEAIHEVTTRGVVVRHVIIGAGAQHEVLCALITDLNLTNHVFLLGAHEEAAVFLRAFDQFILYSRSESFGYVVLEAAQAQLPIIASDVGGIPEIITDGINGTLIADTPNYRTTLADAIVRYHTDPDLAALHAEHAHARFEAFSLDETIARTTALYATHHPQ